MASNSWGQLSWNAGLWGAQSDVIQNVTSFSSLSISQGQANYSPVDGWGRNNWGALGWGVNYANISVSLNSFPLTLTLGDETVAGEINSGWGRYTWGSFAWGINGTLLVTGQQLNTSLNSVSLSITGDIPVTGQQLTTTVNSVQAFGLAIIQVTGIPLTITEGTVDPSPDANVTGQLLTAALGSPLSYNNEGWGRYVWGQQVWGGSGIWATASVTGQALTITEGDETIKADANVTPESKELTITEGVVDPSPDATVTGIGMSVSLAVGTVVVGTGNVTVTGQELIIAQGTALGVPNTIANPTGKQLTASLNSIVAGASALVQPTGIGLTVRLNSINIQSWTYINTGTDANWSGINTGTDATWNEVDTAA